MLFFLPSYESFNVKVTWQIFYIPNVKTTMKFPEGTVFQKLHEIRFQARKDIMLPPRISLDKPLEMVYS